MRVDWRSQIVDWRSQITECARLAFEGRVLRFTALAIHCGALNAVIVADYGRWHDYDRLNTSVGPQFQQIDD